MLPPGLTGSGESVLVSEMSETGPPTSVEAEKVPPRGLSVGATSPWLWTLKPKKSELTFTTSVNTKSPSGRLAIEQATLPPAPTAGVTHDQPAGEASETNVVWLGI